MLSNIDMWTYISSERKIKSLEYCVTSTQTNVKEVTHLLPCVCLSVCKEGNSNSYWWIFTELAVNDHHHNELKLPW